MKQSKPLQDRTNSLKPLIQTENVQNKLDNTNLESNISSSPTKSPSATHLETDTNENNAHISKKKKYYGRWSNWDDVPIPTKLYEALSSLEREETTDHLFYHVDRVSMKNNSLNPGQTGEGTKGQSNNHEKKHNIIALNPSSQDIEHVDRDVHSTNHIILNEHTDSHCKENKKEQFNLLEPKPMNKSELDLTNCQRERERVARLEKLEKCSCIIL